MANLTHFDDQGAAHMVDVSGKAVTARIATARGRVVMAPETIAIIEQGRAKKGDVLSEIAIRFGVAVDEIIKINELENKTIYPGQNIKINI